MLSLFSAIIAVSFFYGLYIYNAFDADLQISFTKSFLLGFSTAEIDLSDEEARLNHFQIAVFFVIFTFTYEEQV